MTDVAMIVHGVLSGIDFLENTKNSLETSQFQEKQKKLTHP